MRNTYTITAKSEKKDYIITVDKNCAARVVDRLMTAFRDIECVNDDTGEVMFNYYISNEIFVPTDTKENVINSLRWG